MTAVVVACLLAGAVLLWPARAGQDVALHLADLPRRRQLADRRGTASQGFREALAADPVKAATDGVRRLVKALDQRVRGDRVREEDVLRLLDGLAAALSAGLPPASALRVVVESGSAVPWVDPVLDAADQGAPLGPVWRQLAEQYDSTALRHVASGWALSERSGAALAPAVATTAETVRRSRDSRQTAQSAASGAMASMYMLSLLPLVGVAGASALGWSPRQLYLEQPLGLMSAGLGVVLLVVGWTVSRKLVASALRGRPVR